MPRIILAEDDKLIHKVYEKILRGEGYELSCHECGTDALEDFKANSADLVIVDMEMPDMLGHEVCEAIRQLPEGTRVPIMIVSGHDDEEDIMKGLNAGANDYLLKPIKPTELKAKIAKLVEYSSGLHEDLDLARNKFVVFGKYRLSKLIGNGAHSCVFLAEALGGDGSFAVKTLKSDIPDFKSFIESFMDASRKLMAMDCPELVKVYECGQQADHYFMVMERADGGTLGERLKNSGPLSEREAARVGANVLKALKALEENQIFHMDVKPDNIMIVDGNYKLGDIGFAKRAGAETTKLSEELWGTPDYLSPEKISGDKSLASSADVYALGVTLYQAVSGANPFHMGNAASTMYSQLNSTPAPLFGAVKGISVEFSSLVAQMLQKNPAERPALATLATQFAALA